jgi:flagellar biosynthesis/type III secretory pathway protein FliH
LRQANGSARTGDASSASLQAFQVFEYPSVSNSGASANPRSTTPYTAALSQPAPNSKPQGDAHREPPEAALLEFDRRLAEETRRAFETGREQGRVEGRQAEREAQAAAVVAAERERLRKVAELIDRFAGERERYFAEVEREVVRLALGIAARILRREAQMDPLLLTGAVRVALGQLSASTAAQLVVPAAELDLWKDAIAHAPNLSVKPVVVAGDGMRLGECVIKTDLGSVDIGLRNQLGEIERGFFDRVGAPRAAVSQGEVVGREVAA